jgi:3-deoxy-D-manno-octulosonate 8-phosphate phosphatase (KDO 8-P phosphatase)
LPETFTFQVLMNMNLLQQLSSISCFVFDMDGVLTDGTLLVLPDGVMARKMNIKDGYALQLAVKKGYTVFVISGGNSPEAKDRLFKLGVEQVWMGVKDKLSLLKTELALKQIPLSQVLYMGDDMPDLAVMQAVGFACCPADAANDIKLVSNYISAFKGGEGCVREVMEQVLKLRGDWDLESGIAAK